MSLEFGILPLNAELIERFERVTGKPAHPFIKRGFIFGHRDVKLLLDDYEAGNPIYIYTGRGPSGPMHLGHLVPFHFTKYLQDVFNCTVVIQMADTEKYYFKDLKFEQIQNYMEENIKDIKAMGFNLDKTFIFSNHQYLSTVPMQNIMNLLLKKISINTLGKTFGFIETHHEESCQGDMCVSPDPVQGTNHKEPYQGINLGQLYSCVCQMAPCFSSIFPHLFGSGKIRCVVAYSVDQDPYFRLVRDVASSLGYPKPVCLIGNFLPALHGKDKMSTTGGTELIYLHDSSEEVTLKIRKYAFSGGRDTLKEHREKGANLGVDIPYQYLRFFEPDDKIVEEIRVKYGSGEMLSKEVKERVSSRINEILKEHQIKRKEY